MTTVAHTNHTPEARSKFLHRALWAAQIVLGLAFVMAGSMKSFTPYPELAHKMAWVSAVPEGLVRFIGISELFGGLGLILPAATRIKPWLTPLAEPARGGYRPIASESSQGATWRAVDSYTTTGRCPCPFSSVRASAVAARSRWGGSRPVSTVWPVGDPCTRPR